MATARRSVAPGSTADAGLEKRAGACLDVIVLLRRARLDHGLEALEGHAAKLRAQLGSLERKEAMRTLGSLEERLLAIDAELGEPQLMGALTTASDRERVLYARLLAMRPIERHRRLERFLKLARRLGERRESPCKPAELLAGLPRSAKRDDAEKALETIKVQRERLRASGMGDFFGNDVLVKLRTERLELAEHVTDPRVLTAMLRFESELEARIATWTRELHEHKGEHAELSKGNPTDHMTAALRKQEQKLLRALGEAAEAGESGARPRRPGLRPVPPAADDLESLTKEFGDDHDDDYDDDYPDDDGNSGRPPGTPGVAPGAAERIGQLRELFDARPGLSMAGAALVLLLAVGALVVYLADPIDEAHFDGADAGSLSRLLLSGDQHGSTFTGTIDRERWEALDRAGREAAADELRVELKHRGIFNADLHLERQAGEAGKDGEDGEDGDEREPVLVIRFAVVQSIAD